jgi:hypothetical protein
MVNEREKMMENTYNTATANALVTFPHVKAYRFKADGTKHQAAIELLVAKYGLVLDDANTGSERSPFLSSVYWAWSTYTGKDMSIVTYHDTTGCPDIKVHVADKKLLKQVYSELVDADLQASRKKT